MLTSHKKELDVLASKAIASDKSTKLKTPEDALKVFCTYWPFLIKVLNVVKIFTSKKTDGVIDKIVEAGNILCPQPGTAAAKSTATKSIKKATKKKAAKKATKRSVKKAAKKNARK